MSIKTPTPFWVTSHVVGFNLRLGSHLTRQGVNDIRGHKANELHL